MVRDGLFRQNETVLRERSACTKDRREKRSRGKHIRTLDDRKHRSRNSGTGPCRRAGKHPIEHGIINFNEHGHEHAIVFRCQVGSGDERG